MKLLAWIEPMSPEPSPPALGAAEECEVTADSYEDGRKQLSALVPEGWRMMSIRVER